MVDKYSAHKPGREQMFLITEVTHGTRLQQGEVRLYEGRGGLDFKRS